MKKYCLALDLKNDPQLIEAYEHWHRHVPAAVLDSIATAGIQNIEIYRIENRLTMILETNDDFSFEKKANADAANPAVVAWENLMWNYQQALPNAAPRQKWMLMQRIF